MASCYLCISLSLPAQHLANVSVTCDHLDSSAAFLGSEKPFQQHRVTWENEDLRREAKSVLEMRHRWGAANGGAELQSWLQTICFNLLCKVVSTRARQHPSSERVWFSLELLFWKLILNVWTLHNFFVSDGTSCSKAVTRTVCVWRWECDIQHGDSARSAERSRLVPAPLKARKGNTGFVKQR